MRYVPKARATVAVDPRTLRLMAVLALLSRGEGAKSRG